MLKASAKGKRKAPVRKIFKLGMNFNDFKVFNKRENEFTEMSTGVKEEFKECFEQ